MKNTVTIISFILISILFIPQTLSQNYEIPSRQMVEKLLAEIEECENNLNDMELIFEKIQEFPEDYTYLKYKRVKEYISWAKKCIADKQKDLDNLRKNYPEWFSDPQATIDLGHGHNITPKQLKKKVKDNKIALTDFLKKWKKFPVPEKD